jgi:hypothetical protein
MEINPGALLTSAPANLGSTYALPASTTALESNPKNRPRRTEVRDKPVRLATCLDRSVAASGAIASTVSPCLPWRKLPPLTERLAVDEPPGVARLIGPKRAVERACALQATAGGFGRGSEDRGEGMGERQRAGRRSGPGRSAAPGGGPAQAKLAGAGSVDGRWIGLGRKAVARASKQQVGSLVRRPTVPWLP